MLQSEALLKRLHKSSTKSTSYLLQARKTIYTKEELKSRTGKSSETCGVEKKIENQDH